MIYEFTVNGKPHGKGRPRVTTRGGYAHAYTPKTTVLYEESIRQAFAYKYGEPKEPTTAMLTLIVTANFNIPSGTNKETKQRMMDGVLLPTSRSDLDNIIKCVADALNEYLYKDDSQIVRISASKRYAETASIDVVVITHGS